MKLDRRLAFLSSLALLSCLPFAFSQEGAPAVPAIRLEPRTVILVRHAEKSGDGDAQDPELSPEGQERAQALARLLARAGATRLFASEFRRTRDTLAPLAERCKLAIEARPAGELDALAVELVSGEPGSVSVVCGHSNTIPALAARLGAPLSGVGDGPNGPALDEAEYDRLFVLHLPPNGTAVRPTVLELRYGR